MTIPSTHGPRLRAVDAGSRRVIIPAGYPLRPNDRIQKHRGKVKIFRNESRVELTKEGPKVKVPACRAILYPYFKRTYTARDGRLITVRTVVKNSDRLACQKLYHYLGWSAGLYVAAEVDGNIVGAIVLSRLVPHMRPSWRRELELSLERSYLEALWIRRLSVRKRMRGLGIGTALAKGAIEIGRDYWLPKPTLVELIATNGSHNFLLHAGFRRAPEGRRRSLPFRESDGSIHRRRETRYYYWCKV